MCSVGDDNFENDADKCMTRTEKVKILSDKCNKCKDEKPCILLRSKDSYCKNCFLAGTNHKFKALLGKSRLIRPNDRVLIHHQVGHPSTALLHFLRTGLDLNTPKKLRFEPVILFIDDQYHLTLDERQDLVNKIKEEVGKFNFKLYFISLADYAVNHGEIHNIIEENYFNVSSNGKEKLGKIINVIASKTNENDIRKIMRRNLLIDAAKHLQCKFVFTPELSVDIASNLLSNIALGRGAHVPIDTGFCDDRDDNVKILRPLRLFDIKEVAFYNIFNDLRPVFVRQPEINPYSSVQDLMEKFVNDLQINYPATVTTILKTGDKLAVDINDAHNEKCRLCKASLTSNGTELHSAESTNISSLVSTELQDYNLSRQDRYSNIIKKFDNQSYTDRNYCFACSKISSFIRVSNDATRSASQ